MEASVPRIEIGDRVAHEGREGYVRHIYPSGVCWVDFVTRGGVSAHVSELKLIEKAEATEPHRHNGSHKARQPPTDA